MASPPEYGRCLKAEKVGKEYKGKFSKSSCTVEVPVTERAKKGKYEWYPGAAKKGQTSSGGKGILEEVGKNAVGCESESSTGQYSGTKEGKNIVVKFKGCKSGGFICTSEGHAAGELETNVLEGRAVWENEAKQKTAIDLYPAAGGDGEFIAFTCGAALTVAVKGSILVPIKPNKMSKTFALKFKAKHGFQTPEDYEEGGKKVEDVLLSDFSNKGYDQAGQNETVTVTNEEELELNAVV
ncbi:MAG TPA: hypothetical protein VMB51_04645 [Solirubrobacteraceae bacterium]|nr:hypothetical protein [Solirubrobacteraceae bacterium]